MALGRWTHFAPWRWRIATACCCLFCCAAARGVRPIWFTFADKDYAAQSSVYEMCSMKCSNVKRILTCVFTCNGSRWKTCYGAHACVMEGSMITFFSTPQDKNLLQAESNCFIRYLSQKWNSIKCVSDPQAERPAKNLLAGERLRLGKTFFTEHVFQIWQGGWTSKKCVFLAGDFNRPFLIALLCANR